MPPVEFETAIPAGEQQQAYSLDDTASRITGSKIMAQRKFVGNLKLSIL